MAHRPLSIMATVRHTLSYHGHALAKKDNFAMMGAMVYNGNLKRPTTYIR